MTFRDAQVNPVNPEILLILLNPHPRKTARHFAAEVDEWGSAGKAVGGKGYLGGEGGRTGLTGLRD